MRPSLFLLKHAYWDQSANREIGICAAPSCPLYRGLSAKLTGGCIDKQLYRSNGAIANLHKPPASAALRQPPKEGARGLRNKSQFPVLLRKHDKHILNETL